MKSNLSVLMSLMFGGKQYRTKFVRISNGPAVIGTNNGFKANRRKELKLSARRKAK